MPLFNLIPEPPSKHCQEKFSPDKEEFDDDPTEDSPTGSHKLNCKHKAALEDANLRWKLGRRMRQCRHSPGP